MFSIIVLSTYKINIFISNLLVIIFTSYLISGWWSFNWVTGRTWTSSCKSECWTTVSCWGNYKMILDCSTMRIFSRFWNELFNLLLSFLRLLIILLLGGGGVWEFQIMWLVDIFRAKIVDISEHSLTIEVISLPFIIMVKYVVNCESWTFKFASLRWWSKSIWRSLLYIYCPEIK